MATYGVFKSSDEGDTWTNISFGLPDSTIRVLNVSSNDKVSCATTYHGFYQYASGVWTEINQGLPSGAVLAVEITKGLNGEMFMMSTTGLVYKWNGSLWNDITYNLPQPGKCLALNSSGTLFAGVFNNGVYKFDGVSNWTIVGAPLANQFVIKMAISSTDSIFAVWNSNNVYKCHADGGTWTLVNNGLPAVNMRYIGIDQQDNLFLSTSSSNGAIYRSINNGDNWSLVTPDLKTTSFNCFSISPNNKIYTGASGVFRSSNTGTSWTDMNPGMSATRFVNCFICAKDGTFYIGNKIGLWKSMNSGLTWQIKNTGITHYGVLQIMESASGALLMHSYNSVPKGAIYRSIDQGDNWTLVAANGCDFYTKLKQSKTDTIWASSRFSETTTLSFSATNGVTWQNNPLTISAIWDIDVSKDYTIFIGSESEGVSRSDNGGQAFYIRSGK